MPSVFLSYDNDDLQLINPLADALAEQGVTVWRDKDKLHGGQKWPKVLGEAIASHDFFLLAWSENAAKSHFVEFEWNTAIALKKTIIPCLLDKTPLPVSLSADHGITVENPLHAVPAILAALQQQPTQADQARASIVIRQLADIRTIKENEVVREAKAIFADEKGILERWQSWIGLTVALLTVVTLLLDLPQKLVGPTSSVPIEQQLAGQVLDERTSEPLQGVMVSLPDFDMKRTTEADGSFRFRVTGQKQASIKFTAQKDGYKSYSNYATLGNTDLRFPLEKSE